MNTILVINDYSPEAENAARMALLIAQHLHCDLVLGNCHEYSGKLIEKVVAGNVYKETCYEHHENDLYNELHLLNYCVDGFKPQINLVDLSDANETAIAGFVVSNKVSIIVRGVVTGLSVKRNGLSNSSLLKKVNCPLLLVPYNWHPKNIERICYIAELRYCRLDVVKYLARFAVKWPADVTIAHLCASGLVKMEERHAQNVFEKNYRNQVNYPRLLFTTVSEHDVRRAIDVFINGMNVDMLVMVNQCFHFKDVFGGAGIDQLPAHLSVPVLVFS